MLTFVAEIRTKGGSNNSEMQITFQNRKTLKTEFLEPP